MLDGIAFHARRPTIYAIASLRTLQFVSVMFLVARPLAVDAQTLQVRVVGVSDGDTVTVLDASKQQHKIRLSGIDAPESGQAFGQRAKQALSECAFGKYATVTGDKIDRYGRTVAKVTVSGVDCNLRQLELGMAWHYKKYEGEQPVDERRAYAQAEARARSKKIGLWIDPSAVPPWDWRNGDAPGTHKGEQRRAHAAGECDCTIGASCIGKRGGSYCLDANARRRYLR